MSLTREPISRRTVLRGAGAMLALPFLEAMLPPRASAAGAAVRPPRRFGIFSVTGGTVLESWKPTETGALTKLPSILRSLDFAKDDLLLLSGLSQTGHSANLNGHENCAFLHLTAAEFAKREGGKIIAGVSVDQLIAQHLGDQTFLPSLEMGSSDNLYSFRNADTPVFSEANPRFIFERMFRGRQPVVPNWQRRAQQPLMPTAKRGEGYVPGQTVVDVLLEQSKDLRRQLAGGDKLRLDAYLDSVHASEKRIWQLEARLRQEALDAQHPGPSKLIEPKLYPDNLSFGDVQQQVGSDPEKHGEYIALLADLMVLAFQTDSTRVVTLSAGSDGCQFPGVVTVGYETYAHTLEHNGNADKPENADPIAREACRQIHAWYTSLFAEIVRKMKAIDEGGSTLLDNSTLLYTSYMSNGGHGTDDYPVLLAGRGGGTLKTGRHVAYEKDTPMANLYVELVNRMGIPADAFGNSKTGKNARYNGRLPDLV